MTQKSDWLSDVFEEAREHVKQWPEWKYSDEVRSELRKLGERKNEAQTAAPAEMKNQQR